MSYGQKGLLSFLDKYHVTLFTCAVGSINVKKVVSSLNTIDRQKNWWKVKFGGLAVCTTTTVKNIYFRVRYNYSMNMYTNKQTDYSIHIKQPRLHTNRE